MHMHLWGSCRAAWKTQPDLTARRGQPVSVMLQYQLWYDVSFDSAQLHDVGLPILFVTLLA
jgi:hypothetical protein